MPLVLEQWMNSYTRPYHEFFRELRLLQECPKHSQWD